MQRLAKRFSSASAPAGFALRLWNGFEINLGGAKPGCTLQVHTPAGLRALLLHRDSLRLGEAYIYGDCDVIGDLCDIFPIADDLIGRKTSVADQLRTAWSFLRYSTRAGAANHAAKLTGNRDSRRRARRAISYHYDLPVDFWRPWLDRNLVYSCAYFKEPNTTLDQAQVAKLDLICRKLRLRPGDRFLDIGCGWGALICHAAKHYGANALGVTLSARQAEYAAEQIQKLDLAASCKVEVRNFFDVAEWGPFDKIASVGAVEHVQSLERYFDYIYRLLEPGGQFLNHGITTCPTQPLREGASFLDRYVFPDYHLASIGETLQAAERAGFDVRDVENLREHYARTVEHWHERFVRARAELERVSDTVRYRIFDLYLAGTAYEFRVGRLHLHQTLLFKPESGKPLAPQTRHEWYDVS
ncbi:MAG: cyclopropane-fatty-acyl-phospholipid synthase [Verrucomicrobiota bacterium]